MKGGQPPGTALLAALYAAVRALQLYPTENEVVIRALADVRQKADYILEHEGGLSVWVAGNYMFVNDLQVRLDLTDYATLAAFREILRQHGVGHVEAEPATSAADWLGFLLALAQDPTPGRPPLEAFEAAIGELVQTEPSAGFEGYYENEEATRERFHGGAYWSGDLAYRDADGNYLMGEYSYKMNVPADQPAVLFWSVAIYSAFDAAGLDNSQKFPSLNSLDDLFVNDDGSVDFYFGPELPEDAPESNYLRTIPGEGFFIILRLYGTRREYYEGTWKPSDLKKIR